MKLEFNVRQAAISFVGMASMAAARATGEEPLVTEEVFSDAMADIRETRASGLSGMNLATPCLDRLYDNFIDQHTATVANYYGEKIFA